MCYEFFEHEIVVVVKIHSKAILEDIVQLAFRCLVEYFLQNFLHLAFVHVSVAILIVLDVDFEQLPPEEPTKQN